VRLFELIGIAGIAISVLAYLPQVVHLAREHCSAGVSSRAWAMWGVSSVLIGAVALQREDPVFILLQISSLTSAAIILYLARRYRGMACETHFVGSGANHIEEPGRPVVATDRDRRSRGSRDGAGTVARWGVARMGPRGRDGDP
jgi:lipid-A-disaccharide synthase-like uncharacterized protein